MDKPDLSEWLTRDEAVRFLGISAKTLERYEARGILHQRKRATMGKRPMSVYDPVELEAVRKALEPKTPDAPGLSVSQAGNSLDRLISDMNESLANEIAALRHQVRAMGANLGVRITKVREDYHEARRARDVRTISLEFRLDELEKRVSALEGATAYEPLQES